MFEVNSEFLIGAVVLGVGATLVLDIWSLFLKFAFKVVGLNYALVGRWIIHGFHGKLFHSSIIQSPKVKGEMALGWVAHYLIGVLFAAAFLSMFGLTWLESLNLAPAIIFGIATVLFPFCLMQPCFGMGIAASKTPKPNLARFKSLTSHTVFGLGLYLTGLLVNQFV